MADKTGAWEDADHLDDLRGKMVGVQCQLRTMAAPPAPGVLFAWWDQFVPLLEQGLMLLRMAQGAVEITGPEGTNPGPTE
jgi:hypothetical protein